MKCDKLNLCIIGFGFIGKTHLQMYQRLSNKPNIWVVDINSNLRKTASDLGVKLYTDYSSVLENKTFDIVDICLPTYLHYPVAKTVLTKTKSHLLVEKPLALNFAEADKLATLSTARERIVMCAMVERFFKPMQELKRWCSRKQAPFQFTFIRSTKFPQNSEWYSSKQMGGDVILDLGIHDIDLLRWFTTSEAYTVNANATNASFKNNNMDKININIKMSDESQASLVIGWDIPKSSSTSFVNKIVISSFDGKRVIFESSKNTLETKNSIKTFSEKRYPHAYFNEINHMVQLVCKQKGSTVDFSEAAKSLRIIDSIKQSIRSGGETIFIE